MAWRQDVAFNPANMGTRPGYCLFNVRVGFGIPGKFPDAKSDMLNNRDKGTLHDISTLPTNVAVPVYLDTNSPYEHIIVSDHGTLYSDGKILSSLKGWKVFGWGELCEDVRVVSYVEEPKPVPEPTPEPDNKVWYTYKPGDTFGQVIKDLGLGEGHLWGDDGTVAYYTNQLRETQPDVFEPNGNIKIGVPFYLIPRSK